ncbi:MAG: NUDIX domain-containing protein [Candidatus Dojkabacteria bacterium]|nr:MAG: NUDIX domain-containing protein [Candidatus Dojkabacteria bacterium]
MIQLHDLQKNILKTLAFQKSARFNELLIENLESEHMNYHLKRLIEMELVTKNNDKYELTDKGKDYSNLMNDELTEVEKQPKASVLLRVVRKNSETNEVEHLLCKRLKHPYFGKVGRLTGKIRFGESFAEAAKRELKEETGLDADTIILEEIYHKIRYKKERQEVVQDVIFYTCFIVDPTGELVENLPYQENFWISAQELKKNKEIDPFDGLVLDDRLEAKPLSLIESIAEAEGF